MVASSQSHTEIRTVVLDAANTIVATKGPEALSLPTLCAAANVNPALLAKMFGNREGIVQAAADFRHSKYTEGWASLQPTGNPMNDFRGAWVYHNDFIRTHPPIPLTPPGAWSLVSSRISKRGQEVIVGGLASLQDAGLLRISHERATLIVHVALLGWAAMVQDQAEPPKDRHSLSFICESVLLMITSSRIRPGANSLRIAALTLLDNISDLDVVSPGEGLFLREILMKNVGNQSEADR